MSAEDGQLCNVGAEVMVLGAILLDQDVIDDIALAPGDFYRPGHETIFAAMLRMREDHQPIDPMTVFNRLTIDGDANRSGGAPYLHHLVSTVPTVANAQHYAEIVSRYAGLRRLQVAGLQVQQIAEADNEDDLGRVQSLAEQQIKKALISSTHDRAEWVHEGIDDILSEFENPTPSIPTPWPKLSRLIGGWAPGRLYVIGARPSVGKSVMGLEATQAYAARTGKPSMFVSLEMSPEEVRRRLVSCLAEVNYANLERHELTSTDWDQIAGIRGALGSIPLAIPSMPNMRISDIRRMARRLARESDRGAGMICVDYLQLLSSPDARRNRHEVVAEFSRTLKLLALELEVPVVALSQLNRALEMRADKAPTMADLRESGSVEQDADVVILMHRDKDEPYKLHCNVDKNRQGERGRCLLTFQGWWMRILDETDAYVPEA